MCPLAVYPHNTEIFSHTSIILKALKSNSGCKSDTACQTCWSLNKQFHTTSVVSSHTHPASLSLPFTVPPAAHVYTVKHTYTPSLPVSQPAFRSSLTPSNLTKLSSDRSSRVRERKGDERVKGRVLFSICWGGMGGWNRLPPTTEAFWLMGASDRRSPREATNAAEPCVREKEGGKEAKKSREKREESHNSRLSPPNSYAVMTSEGMWPRLSSDGTWRAGKRQVLKLVPVGLCEGSARLPNNHRTTDVRLGVGVWGQSGV